MFWLVPKDLIQPFSDLNTVFKNLILIVFSQATKTTLHYDNLSAPLFKMVKFKR